ncbi:GumC family protein [Rhizobium alvei]|uniref:GumC family protein n=1 Tax=Rhizobium alvei TaxID=1132659 RepID=A0ABT8YFA4_9HYPH|nr:GumC family protein [Rhizobium alvei]MDO6962396.1 GumC family protein [Rhizobium alvei]
MDIFSLPGIILKRWLYVIVPVVLFVCLAAAYVVVVKPTTPVVAEILIDPQGLAAEQGKLAPDPSAPNQDAAILESQIYVLQSSEILGAVVDRLDLTKDPFIYAGSTADKELAKAAAISSLQKRLAVERAGQSFVVELTFKHVDARKGAEIVNTIASVFLKKIHEARGEATSRMSGAFELQAETLAARVRKAETELEKFKAEKGIVSTGQQGLVIDQQVEGVNKQLITARAELGAKLASYDQAKAVTVGSIEAGGIPEALNSTALGTMRARYADLVSTANELASSLGANHPQMRAARSQVEGMRGAIEQELTRIRQSLKNAVDRSQANVNMLQSRLDTLTQSSNNVSEAGIKARELQSEVDTLRALYKAFLSRSEELGQNQAVNINNSRIITKAVALGGGSSLAKLLIIAAAGLFGIAVGSVLAVLRENFNELFGRGSAADLTEPSQPSDAAQAVPTPAAAPASIRVAEPAASSAIAQMGMDGAAERILSLASAKEMPTILFLSADNDNDGEAVVARLANALYRRNKNVLYSSGHGNERVEAISGSRLRFERLSHEMRARNAGAPTFRHFVGRSGKADVVLIDAGAEDARRQLLELLDKAQGIFVLTSADSKPQEVSNLVASLDPWKDRMLGTISSGRAA